MPAHPTGLRNDDADPRRDSSQSYGPPTLARYSGTRLGRPRCISLPIDGCLTSSLSVRRQRRT